MTIADIENNIIKIKLVNAIAYQLIKYSIDFCIVIDIDNDYTIEGQRKDCTITFIVTDNESWWFTITNSGKLSSNIRDYIVTELTPLTEEPQQIIKDFINSTI